MLIRNINYSEGLYNGMQLICWNFNCNIINAQITGGHHSEKGVFIPRIPFLPYTIENGGFSLKKKNTHNFLLKVLQ